MTSPDSQFNDELRKIQQAIAAQEQLADILPPEQLADTLSRLHQKEAELRAQIFGDAVGGDKVAGDKVGRDKIVQHIVNIYQEGGGSLPEAKLRRAIAEVHGHDRSGVRRGNNRRNSDWSWVGTRPALYAERCAEQFLNP